MRLGMALKKRDIGKYKSVKNKKSDSLKKILNVRFYDRMKAAKFPSFDERTAHAGEKIPGRTDSLEVQVFCYQRL